VDRETLEGHRVSLLAQAREALVTHNRALGAIEYIDRLLQELDKESGSPADGEMVNDKG